MKLFHSPRYQADIGEARRVLLDLLRGDERVRERPPPEVVVTELGASSVNLALRFWLKNPHHEVPIEFEYRERVKQALDAAGIEIPFPQVSLRVERMPRVRVGRPPAAETDPEPPEGS